MLSAATDAAATGAVLDTLRDRLATIAASSFVPAADVKTVMIRGWEDAVTRALEDNVLSEEEESHLVKFSTQCDLSQADLDGHGAFRRVAMNAALSDVLAGRVRERMQVKGELPFNILKTEKLVWVFTPVTYCEERVARSYVGGYQGASIRIMKAVYYHAGGFKGRPVEASAMAQIDVGQVAVTTHHLYFGGAHGNFRIPYPKIVALTPYSDGICVTRDAVRARPQVFVAGDGWFVYNLVTNLVRL